MSAQLPRGAAGSFQLHGGTGGLLHIVGLPRYMEAYKVDATFRIESPETIDPAGTNAQAPWVVTRIDGVGASSPSVARTMIQGNQMIGLGVFADGFDKEAVLAQLHDCKEQLVVCEQAASRLRKHIEATVQRIQSEGIGRDNQGRALNPFPSTPNFESDTTTFLVRAKHAVAAVTKLVAAMLDMDVQGANFALLESRLVDARGADDPLAEFVGSCKDGVKRLVDLRNFQEHPGEVRTILRDFHAMPDRIGAPIIHLSTHPPAGLYQYLGDVAAFLIDIAEGVFVHCLRARLSKDFPFAVYGYADTEIDPNCPVRLYLSIDMSRIRFPPRPAEASP